MRKDCPQLEELRNEVIAGTITDADIQKRLSAAIEAEYLKPQPDAEFISLCEDMLWHIGTQGEQPLPSSTDRYLELIEQHAQPEHTSRTNGSLFNRLAILVTAFVLIVALSGGAIHFRWFTQSSSPDKQQYVIKGHEISIDMIEQCIAEHEEYSVLQTDDWIDVCEFIGFDLPTIYPEALDALQVKYDVHIEPGIVTLYAQYTDSEEVSLALFSICCFTDTEEALFAFEQDTNGNRVIIQGQEIYIVSNVDRVSFAWLSDNCICNLAGHFSYEKGIDILNELIGGE